MVKVFFEVNEQMFLERLGFGYSLQQRTMFKEVSGETIKVSKYKDGTFVLTKNNKDFVIVKKEDVKAFI